MTLVQNIQTLFLQRHWTLATAESCTGGGLAMALVENPGASAYFRSGVIAYADAAKETLLQIDPELIKKEGAVSGKVAEAMALSIQKSLQTTIAIATTGIAGPGGGTSFKPVGTVFFAVVGPGAQKRLFSLDLQGDRAAIQKQTVDKVLQKLFDLLN